MFALFSAWPRPSRSRRCTPGWSRLPDRPAPKTSQVAWCAIEARVDVAPIVASWEFPSKADRSWYILVGVGPDPVSAR